MRSQTPIYLTFFPSGFVFHYSSGSICLNEICSKESMWDAKLLVIGLPGPRDRLCPTVPSKVLLGYCRQLVPWAGVWPVSENGPLSCTYPHSGLCWRSSSASASVPAPCSSVPGEAAGGGSRALVSATHRGDSNHHVQDSWNPWLLWVAAEWPIRWKISVSLSLSAFQINETYFFFEVCGTWNYKG